MDEMIKDHLPFLFLALFVPGWLALTTIFGFLSGWYSLTHKYPNRKEKELLRLRHEQGWMRLGVGMHVNMSACPSGLRVGTPRIFGIFCRDFFVPWEEIRVRRKRWFFSQAAELQFGIPAVGKLTLEAHVADRLARSAAGLWPETGTFPGEPKKR